MPPSDPLHRAARRFSALAGAALLIIPFVTLALDLLEFRTLPPRLMREVSAFLVPLMLAMFGSVMLDFTLTLSSMADRFTLRELRPAAAAERRSRLTPRFVFRALIVALAIAGVADNLLVAYLDATLTQRSRDSIARFSRSIEAMLDYRYAEDWLADTKIAIDVIAQQGNYASVALIVQDAPGAERVSLEFDAHSTFEENQPDPRTRLILRASAEEHAYLDAVFRDGKAEPRFSAASRHYQVMMPVHARGSVGVLKFVVNDR